MLTVELDDLDRYKNSVIGYSSWKTVTQEMIIWMWSGQAVSRPGRARLPTVI